MLKQIQLVSENWTSRYWLATQKVSGFQTVQNSRHFRQPWLFKILASIKFQNSDTVKSRFQICGFITWMMLFTIISGFQPSNDQTIELTLCGLLKHTPFFVIYQLHDKSNCLSHVKHFGKIICLRDGENKVNTNFI